MPDELLTPAIVARTLSNIGQDLDAMPDIIKAADKAEVEARKEARKAYRRAFMEATGAMDLRKIIAEEAASDLDFAAELAGVELRAARTHLSVLRERREIGQSIGTIVKLEWGAS